MEKLHNLLQLIESTTMNDRQFEDKLGFKHSSIYNWRNGRAEPKLADLFVLSDYFEVSVDYLVGREKPTSINISSNKKDINEIFDKLTERNQNKAIGMKELPNFQKSS